MADISTDHMDIGTDSPAAARTALYEAVRRVNELSSRTVSVREFGALVDGTTVDIAALNAALAPPRSELTIPLGDLLVNASPTDLYGPMLQGPGRIMRPITGGKQQLNSYGDKYQIVFGREYLAAFHNLLVSQAATPTRKPIVIFSGDSTTYGVGNGVDADYTVYSLFQRAATERGLQTAYGMNVMNGGHPGMNTQQWLDTVVAGDMTLNPDLLVLRWGINDPGWLKNGTAPPLDGGQDYPNRRDITDYVASLRAGLTYIRSLRSLSSLSIVLMSPSSTSDTPNGRDERWYEQIVPAIKKAARDFNCCFVDTYAYLRDSRPAAGIWMDNPFSDGRAIHPNNAMNTWIMGLVVDVLLPAGLKDKIGSANVRNISGAEDVGDASRLPSYYNKGITISRALTGFPSTGSVVTIRSADETAMQIFYPFADADRGFCQVRVGTSAVLGGATVGWGAWVNVGGKSSEVSPATGYAVSAGTTAMRVAVSGNSATIEGFVTKTTPAVVAAGTVVATIPVGSRPVREALWNVPVTIYTGGGTFEFIRGQVLPDGSVIVAQTTTGTVARVYVNASWSLLP